jgi:hypothetical protein
MVGSNSRFGGTHRSRRALERLRRLASGEGRQPCASARHRRTLSPAVIVLALTAAAVAYSPTASLAAYPGTSGLVAYEPANSAGEPEGIAVVDPQTGTGPGLILKNNYETTTPCENGIEPTWSPDGTKMAFVSSVELIPARFPDEESEQYSVICVMNADGSDRHPLTHPSLDPPLYEPLPNDFSPTWSPEGSQIAYSRDFGEELGSEPPGIWSVSSTGGSEVLIKKLTFKGAASGAVKWSPTNSQELAYTFVSGIYVLNLATQTSRLVAENRAGGFDWLPNGSGLVLAPSPGIDPDVTTITLSGEETQVPNTEGAQWVEASPEGGGVLYEGCATEGCGVVNHRLEEPDTEISPNEPEVTLADPIESDAATSAKRGRQTAEHAAAAKAIIRPSPSLGGGLPLSDGAPVATQPQQLPIIYLPGFAASTLECGTQVVWPPGPGNLPPPIRLLDLDENGSDKNCPAGVKAGPPVTTILGKDFGAGMIKFLENLKLPVAWGNMPWPTAAFGWDWRKRPQASIGRLQELVETELKSPVATAEGVTKVTLVAHSYGGLLARAFLAAHKEEVGRVLTIGTPYWGAAKAIFPLAIGQELPGTFTSPLNFILNHTEFQEFAQNLEGNYELYPSIPVYGTWLMENGSSLGEPEVEQGIVDLSGNRRMYQETREDHKNLFDGFTLTPSDKIEYQEVFGGGLATPVGVELNPLGGSRANMNVILGNGDGTVPLRSASQGAPVTSKGVYETPLPYHSQIICGIGHTALPINPRLLDAYESYLKFGKRPDTLDTPPCPAAGGVWKFESLTGVHVGPSVVHSRAETPAAGDEKAANDAGVPELGLQEAAEEELADVFEAEPDVFAVVNQSKPVELSLNTENLTFTYKPLEGETQGATATYGPLSGHITLESGSTASTPTVEVNGVTVTPKYEEGSGGGEEHHGGDGSGSTGGSSSSDGASGSSGASGSGAAVHPPMVSRTLSELVVHPSAITTRKDKHRHVATTTTTTISYHDSQAATTTVTIQQELPGVVHGHICAAPPRHPHGKPRHCTRYLSVGSITHNDTVGTNSIRFNGRVDGRSLAAGTYRLELVAHSSTGQASQQLTTTLHILG